jgi:ankyrin repeat protein
VNARNGAGRTPLLQAAGNGQLTVVRLLLGRGADVNAADQAGRSPLVEAMRGGHTAVADLLREAGASEPEPAAGEEGEGGGK